MLNISAILSVIIFLIFVAQFYHRYRFSFEFNHKFFMICVPFLCFGVFFFNLAESFVGKLIAQMNLVYLFGIFDVGYLMSIILTFIVSGGLFWGALRISNSFKQVSYRKTGFYGLVVLSLVTILTISFQTKLLTQLGVVFLFFFVALVLTGIFVQIFDFFSRTYKLLFDKLNFFVIYGQVLDAIGVIVFYSMGVGNIGRVSFDFGLNPFVWGVIKVVSAFLICWSFDWYAARYINKRNFSRFSKLVIAAIGLVLGFYDIILLTA